MKATTNQNQAEKFAEWMLKIKSVHYANNNAMSRAFEKFEPKTVTVCKR